MTESAKKIFETGIIPVIVIDDAKDAIPLAKALCEGGLPAAEVTFRTAAAADAIRMIREAFPDMLLGAGTVLTKEQADTAMECGASFIVSPGLNPNIVSHCLELGVDVIPGCATPSDIERALELGLDTVKFFPAEANGGVAALKAISAPYRNVKFMPTGGIGPKNVLDYLALDCVLGCGGSFMASTKDVKEGNFDAIRKACADAVKLIHGFTVMHVGINAGNAGNAASIAQSFSPFGFEVSDNDSIFLDRGIEIMKAPWYGEKGHIAVGTNNIKRAEAYLKTKGVRFIEESKNPDAKGNYKAVYIDGDFGGFAVHLVQK